MKKTKLELLSELGDVLTSKFGSKYVVLSSTPITVNREMSPYSVTRNTLSQIGVLSSYTKNDKEIILLKNNKFFYKSICGEFKPLSKNHVINKEVLVELYLYGRKCEYLKNYDISYLRFFNFLKSFTSFKEVKDFLGYTFISVEDFLKLDIFKVLYFAHLPANVAISFVNSDISVDLYRDCKAMAGIDFVSPTSITSLKKYHDDLVLKQSLAALELKSKTVITFPHPIDNIVDDVSIKRITSDYDLYKEGLEMNHCIGSRSYSLPNKVFLSITWQNERYSCQISGDKIDEIKGYRNGRVPNELIGFLNNHLK